MKTVENREVITHPLRAGLVGIMNSISRASISYQMKVWISIRGM